MAVHFGPGAGIGGCSGTGCRRSAGTQRRQKVYCIVPEGRRLIGCIFPSRNAPGAVPLSSPKSCLHGGFTFVIRLGIGAMLASSAVPACAQLRSAYPPATYYGAQFTMYTGDFRNALDAFQALARSGLRFGNQRWADSICYHAMQGECYYHLGQFPLALEQYDQAMRILVQNPDWLRRVEFPNAIPPSQSRIRQTIGWGSRPSVMGEFKKMQVLFGNLDPNAVLENGGVFSPQEMRSADVAEIIRCTAVALRRRAELLGPVGPTDPLSSSILNAVEGRIGRPNHWSQAWIELQRGLALLAMDKPGEAADRLQRSLLIGGAMDHPSTGIALFELGRIAEHEAKFDLALENYLQASLAAAQYEHGTLVEEALHRLSVVHITSGAQGVPPGLELAAAWARKQRYSQLYSGLTADVAEQLATLGDKDSADVALTDARRVIGRRNRVSVQVASRLAMQNAVIRYANKKGDPAREALADAIRLRKTCSPWLFQLSLVNSLYESNADVLSDREATQLYEELLRQPNPNDWANNVLDTLAVTSVRKDRAFDHWFEVSLRRSEPGRAIEIAEQCKCHRLMASLPLGGRLMSLRWMLNAPVELLSAECVNMRHDVTARYSDLVDLGKRVEKARDALRHAKVLPNDKDSFKKQLEAGKRVHSLAQAYESELGALALRREASPVAFPPPTSLADIQQRLKPKQLVVAYYVTDKRGYAMMISSTNHALWKLPSISRCQKGVVALLREMGLSGDSNSLSLATLQDDAWKARSKQLVPLLFEERQFGFWRQFDELLIVPDGFLWYLPFESLVVTNDANEEVPMILSARMRYAPTISLATSRARKQPRAPRSVAVLGQLYPRDDINLSRDQLSEIQKVVEGLEALPPKPAAPSGILRAGWDRLVVFDDLKNTKASTWGWAPAGFDSKRPQTSLARWMQVPWGGPLEVFLPGFHSAAENGLRKGADGDELFLALSGLMASGADTILISRWRTGGQSSYDLLRGYMEDSAFSPPPEAWQRSVMMLRETELNPDWEPRVTMPPGSADVLTADHPFFWSGYLLCGTNYDSNAAQKDRPDKMRAPAEPGSAPPLPVAAAAKDSANRPKAKQEPPTDK